jgi:hypothetical protein
MKIKKNTTVTLSVQGLKQIVTEYLSKKGMDVKSIRFPVSGKNEEGDWRSEYPLRYSLDEAVCEVEEKHEELSKESK